MSYIRKIVSVLCLILCLAFLLGACNKENQQEKITGPDTVTTAAAETTEALSITVPATTVPETTAQEETVQYEIISAQAIEYIPYDEYEMTVLVEFKNTGTCNMYLPEMGSTYDLEDADGNLISAQNPIYAMPTVLKPGEIGYLSTTELYYKHPKGNNLTVIPRIRTKPATLDCIRYEVTNLQYIMGDHGIKILGKVTNTGTETYKKNYIACFLYDKNGNLLCDELANVEFLAPGETTGFETFGLGIPGETIEEVAEIVCYAYPVLTQD